MCLATNFMQISNELMAWALPTTSEREYVHSDGGWLKFKEMSLFNEKAQ